MKQIEPGVINKISGPRQLYLFTHVSLRDGSMINLTLTSLSITQLGSGQSIFTPETIHSKMN